MVTDPILEGTTPGAGSLTHLIAVAENDWQDPLMTERETFYVERTIDLARRLAEAEHEAGVWKGRAMRFDGERIRAEAEVAELRAENERLTAIRELLIKSVIKATGRAEADVREMPLTCAKRHVEADEAAETLIGELTEALEKLHEHDEQFGTVLCEPCRSVLAAALRKAQEYRERQR